MNRTLFAKELRANLFVSLIIAAVLAMYIGVIVSMYDPELGESLDAMMQSMPEMFAAFGMSVQATTLIDFMLNYLYGFLLTIFILVLILIVANKLMVRYLDRGAMAYLLATPNSRTRIALTMVGVMVTILVALMAVVTALEVGFAEALFPGELDMQALMQVNAGLLALWLAMAGLCFLSACLFSNATAALVGGRRPEHPVLPHADGIAGGRQVRVPEERQPADAVRLLRPGRGRRVSRRRRDRAGRGRGGAVRRGGCGLRSARPQHLEQSARERAGTALGRPRPLMFTPALQPA